MKKRNYHHNFCATLGSKDGRGEPSSPSSNNANPHQYKCSAINDAKRTRDAALGETHAYALLRFTHRALSLASLYWSGGFYTHHQFGQS